MEQSKHTPGEIKYRKSLKEGCPFELYNSSENTTLAYVTNLTKNGTAEGNAALFASAGALLEENKKLQNTNGLLETKLEIKESLVTQLETENKKLKHKLDVKSQELEDTLQAHNKFVEEILLPENKKLKEMLQAFHDMFIHKDGEEKKNKLKTDIIKYCDEVKETLSNSRELLWDCEKAKHINQ